MRLLHEGRSLHRKMPAELQRTRLVEGCGEVFGVPRLPEAQRLHGGGLDILRDGACGRERGLPVVFRAGSRLVAVDIGETDQNGELIIDPVL
jgi:hypothetical protein